MEVSSDEQQIGQQKNQRQNTEIEYQRKLLV